MSNYAEVIYNDEITEEVKVHKLTGVWKLGTYTKVDNQYQFNNWLELRYFDGLKPHWFHRLMARLLLGWHWEDKK